MSEQIDLFGCKDSNVIAVSSGWFIAPSKTSTAVNQSLYFDVPGAASTYHAGQKSHWILNGIDRSAFYLDGDPCRSPSKVIIEKGSAILIELTLKGALFPHTLERVIYSSAWEKGANAGFNEEAADGNPYDQGTPHFEAWLDGWRDNASQV